MENTFNLDLPYILPSQAQKHVTHNEALKRLDAIVQLSVIDSLGTPPGSPAEGDRYIVASPASGDWTGKAGEIAAFQDGVWEFYAPQPGWLAAVTAGSTILRWDGSSWTTPCFNQVPLLGVGTAADNANPFAAKLNNALWTAKSVSEGGDGDLRYKMNKESESDTLSLLLQSGYSGRAEIGLIGNNNLSMKVSADGASWREALTVEQGTGKLQFPNTAVATDYAINLLQDSGRFAGNNVNAITVGAFTFPAYLLRYNSTTASGIGKFITDNTDYGGAAGTLNANVKALIDLIRDSGFRRYGQEFWVAQLTQGAGTASSITHLSQTWYLSMQTNQTLRTPRMTFHTYLRALDDNILIRRNSGHTLFLNGVASQNHVVVAPSDGWVSVLVQENLSPRQSAGYGPSIFIVYAKASGHRYLMACPALMGGITKVDVDIGLVPATGSWPA